MVTAQELYASTVRNLPADERLRLAALILDDLAESGLMHSNLNNEGEETTQRTTLRGMWQGLNITEEDIRQARQEMWGNFPREDV